MNIFWNCTSNGRYACKIINLKSYGGRSFTIATPSVWNALPFKLRSCNSLSSFKSKLKTWLFKIGYDVV